MQQEERKYWLALNAVNGLGITGQISLIEAFSTPEKVFSASFDALCSVSGIGKILAQRIHSFNEWNRIENELKYYIHENITILSWQDSTYPQLLSHIYDPPALLFIKGAFGENVPRIAVVGSRVASSYGLFVTENISRELVLHGITVVSGLARGIDTAAHRGAISGRGQTIAVLGNGLDTIYPPENHNLSKRISEHGALITEYPVGTPPHASHFPARNRIISGLCQGVLVVEAGEKSGSLITARLALEQGREVFAIPGAIDSPGSKGTHKLLKDGAKLVESVEDILEEIVLALDLAKTNKPVPKAMVNKENALVEGKIDSKKGELSFEEQTFLSHFRNSPKAVDELICLTGLSCQTVQQLLMMIEIKGYLQKMAGSKYAIKE